MTNARFLTRAANFLPSGTGAMTKSNKTTVEMVNDAIDKADLTPEESAESRSVADEAAKPKSVADKLTKDVEQYVNDGVEKFQVIAGEYSEKLNKAASTASDQAKKDRKKDSHMFALIRHRRSLARLRSACSWVH